LRIEHLKRTFSRPGAAGGHIVACDTENRGSHRNGDRILLDFADNFFAISDSSDRNPESSAKCLLSFAGVMQDCHGEQLNKRIKTADLENLMLGLALQSEAILSGMKGNALCTFTGIRILKMWKGMKGILMHTGDSSLYECAPGNKRITKLTKSNFWMVGKTDRFYQIDLVDIKPDVLLLLATDGIPDLTNTSGDNYNNDTNRIIFSHPVEEIPQKLIEAVARQCSLNDDAAVLSVLPGRIHPSDRRILLEGG